ncbi:hypothetical protein [Rossellomorea sp. FM04394]|uniref:hypothetical protein n=1 Tax=Rossellomorea sp. FM04394 TaxID=3243076 RepID=UPI0035A609A9
MWEGHTEKVDKGFELIYFRLSYRRKMIRTLWMTLLLPVSYFLLRFMGLDLFYTWIFMAVFLLGHLAQLYYNYYMWNKYERDRKE